MRFLLWCPFWVMAQSQIEGTAQLNLVESGSACFGQATTIEVWADLSSVTGVGGDIGLDAFHVVLFFNVPNAFASLKTSPSTQEWFLNHTWKNIANAQSQLSVVGTSLNNPVTSEHILLFEVTLVGPANTFEVGIQAEDGSLASRWINGLGPETIPAVAGQSINTILLPAVGTLGEALVFWSFPSPFDWNNSGQTDIQDLIQILACTAN